VLPSPFTTDVGSICDPGFVRGAMAGVSAVIHTATLHKPHVATHSRQAFIDVNLTGTLTLLEAAVEAGVGAFVYTSTTSAFGSALSPAPGEPAAWITEDVRPVPRNIYGVTKVAAESLCELFHRDQGLPVVVLRTSRFFPEADDVAAIADVYALENVQANELLYRRVDIADAVDAHLLVDEPHLRIIDFDDCGFSWFVYDFATAVSFIEHEPVVPQLLRAWLAGYRKTVPLSPEDGTEIPTFVVLRRILLTAWLASHAETPAARQLGAAYTSGTVMLAQQLVRGEFLSQAALI